MKKVLGVVGLFVVILIIAFAVFVHFNRPSFLIKNHTKKELTDVKVYWRDNVKKLPAIKAGQSLKMYIAAEAAAKFVVTFPDSKIIEGKDIYFTGGTKIIVDIYDGNIETKYDFDR